MAASTGEFVTLGNLPIVDDGEMSTDPPPGPPGDVDHAPYAAQYSVRGATAVRPHRGVPLGATCAGWRSWSRWCWRRRCPRPEQREVPRTAVLPQPSGEDSCVRRVRTSSLPAGTWTAATSGSRRT